MNGLYGPFTSFIGAERELAGRHPSEVTEGERRRMWVHPMSSTVGSALRRVQESMVEFMGQRPTALALVPADGDPAWAKMLKHGLVVGHYPAGSPCLSAHTVAGWRDCTNKRPLSLVLFPRAAGARAVQLTQTMPPPPYWQSCVHTPAIPSGEPPLTAMFLGATRPSLPRLTGCCCTNSFPRSAETSSKLSSYGT